MNRGGELEIRFTAQNKSLHDTLRRGRRQTDVVPIFARGPVTGRSQARGQGCGDVWYRKR